MNRDAIAGELSVGSDVLVIETRHRKLLPIWNWQKSF
jgi:hypothetical protein